MIPASTASGADFLQRLIRAIQAFHLTPGDPSLIPSPGVLPVGASPSLAPAVAAAAPGAGFRPADVTQDPNLYLAHHPGVAQGRVGTGYVPGYARPAVQQAIQAKRLAARRAMG